MNADAGEFAFEVTWTEGCVDPPLAKNFTGTFEANVAYQVFTDENDHEIHEVSLVRLILYFKLFLFRCYVPSMSYN